MKLNFDLPLETNSGEPVTILTREARGEYPIIGHVGDQDQLSYWTINGTEKYDYGATRNSLRNVPQKVEGWVAVHRRADNGSILPSFYYSLADLNEDLAGAEVISVTKIDMMLEAGRRDDLEVSDE